MLTKEQFDDLLDRYPELRAGILDHLGEVIVIAARILWAESRGLQGPPVLPADAPDWERNYWARREDDIPLPPLPVDDDDIELPEVTP